MSVRSFLVSHRFKTEKGAADVTVVQGQGLVDRKPATVSVAESRTEGVNFVRQYLMEDGSYAGPGFGNFKKTIVATWSNDYRSYLPSVLAFEHGGYTVDRCRFKPGIGEDMAQHFVEELNGLYQTN